MTPMFYDVDDDVHHSTGWWLDKVTCLEKSIDCRGLCEGRHFDSPGTLFVAVKKRGEPLDFTIAALDVPVVTTRVADLIDKHAPGAVERFPIDVAGSKGRYEVLNVVRVIDAIDRERSGYMLWKPEDGRPEKVGQFRQIHSLVMKANIRQDVGLFRPLGWEVALVVSAALKNELEKMHVRGIRYRPLEGGFTAN